MKDFEVSQHRENPPRKVENTFVKSDTQRKPAESKENENENAIANWPIEKIMRRLLREGKHFDQDIVYETLMKELPAEEIETKIMEDYMSCTGESIIDKVRQALGDDYVRLLIEPSIGTRVDELIEFAQIEAREEKLLAPIELRRKFKESLGKKKVYRVATLTEQELQEIKQDGFLANYYRVRSEEEILQNEDGYESVEYNLSNLIGRVNVHAGGFANTKDSILISTSDFPEMAQYAAFVQLKDDWQEREKTGQKLYLIPIEIDEFRNIRYGKYLPHHIKAEGTWHSDQKDIPYNDSGVESFVEFRISSENILTDEIRQIDTTQIPNFKFVSKGK